MTERETTPPNPTREAKRGEKWRAVLAAAVEEAASEGPAPEVAVEAVPTGVRLSFEAGTLGGFLETGRDRVDFELRAPEGALLLARRALSSLAVRWRSAEAREGGGLLAGSVAAPRPRGRHRRRAVASIGRLLPALALRARLEPGDLPAAAVPFARDLDRLLAARAEARRAFAERAGRARDLEDLRRAFLEDVGATFGAKRCSGLPDELRPALLEAWLEAPGRSPARIAAALRRAALARLGGPDREPERPRAPYVERRKNRILLDRTVPAEIVGLGDWPPPLLPRLLAALVAAALERPAPGPLVFDLLVEGEGGIGAAGRGRSFEGLGAAPGSEAACAAVLAFARARGLPTERIARPGDNRLEPPLRFAVWRDRLELWTGRPFPLTVSEQVREALAHVLDFERLRVASRLGGEAAPEPSGRIVLAVRDAVEPAAPAERGAPAANEAPESAGASCRASETETGEAAGVPVEGAAVAGGPPSNGDRERFRGTSGRPPETRPRGAGEDGAPIREVFLDDGVVAPVVEGGGGRQGVGSGRLALSARTAIGLHRAGSPVVLASRGDASDLFGLAVARAVLLVADGEEAESSRLARAAGHLGLPLVRLDPALYRIDPARGCLESASEGLVCVREGDPLTVDAGRGRVYFGRLSVRLPVGVPEGRPDRGGRRAPGA